MAPPIPAWSERQPFKQWAHSFSYKLFTYLKRHLLSNSFVSHFLFRDVCESPLSYFDTLVPSPYLPHTGEHWRILGEGEQDFQFKLNVLWLAFSIDTEYVSDRQKSLAHCTVCICKALSSRGTRQTCDDNKSFAVITASLSLPQLHWLHRIFRASLLKACLLCSVWLGNPFIIATVQI